MRASPTAKKLRRGMAANLIILNDTRVLPERDFLAVARRVRERAPDIHAYVVTERRGLRRAQLVQLLRPTLFVEIQKVAKLKRWRGALAGPQARARGKMAAYRVLEAGGIAVPAWREVVPGIKLDPAEWGPWMVVKPDRGRRGIDVEVLATAEVRYRPPEELPAGHLGRESPMLAQRFISTVDEPAFYRVTTCFGEPIFAIHYFAPAGQGTVDDGSPKIMVQHFAARLIDDADLLDLGRRVHALLPEVPTIGCDVLRDRETGKLWIAEINQSSVWALSSPVGIGFQSKRGLDLYGQFGALDRAAEAMVRATRQFAR